jgi:glycosyltransferase involved in cell wall biosynthesis
VYWANLIKDKTYPNTKTVIAIEDFVTLQFLYAQQTKSNFGVMLEEEIARINQFDVAICISSDEKYFFSQFAARPKFYFVPQYFPNRANRASGNFTYDLLFIGSANPHNQKSIAWFFSHVYPALSPDYRILLVGKISDYADDRPNVTKIRFADDLDEIYRQVKVAICPMLQGTGMKIKVVEALSYGKPVVCTIKGVDGFPQKHDNGCLIADEPEAFAALVSRLLEEEAFYTAHQRRAIAYFAGTFEQSKVFSTLDEIFSHP